MFSKILLGIIKNVPYSDFPQNSKSFRVFPKKNLTKSRSYFAVVLRFELQRPQKTIREQRKQ